MTKDDADFVKDDADFVNPLIALIRSGSETDPAMISGGPQPENSSMNVRSPLPAATQTDT